jgi:hypothetical protein
MCHLATGVRNRIFSNVFAVDMRVDSVLLCLTVSGLIKSEWRCVHPKMVLYEQNKLSYLNMILHSFDERFALRSRERDRARALRPYFHSRAVSEIIRQCDADGYG